MRYAYVASFVLGLLLGVRAMFHGVERPAKSRKPVEGGGMSGRRFALNLPTTASFASAFGATGYLLARYTGLSVPVDLAIAAAAGALGAAGALLLVAAWAIPAARSDAPDERYLLQGEFARVVEVSAQGDTGRVTYVDGGVSHTVQAAPLDDARLELGAEVVIERIENGVAFVEPWARVEARL